MALFEDLVVIVTGAGGGIGREYAHFFSSNGAKVFVNDVIRKDANAVVEEIKKSGGEAEANYESVENGNKIVEAALNRFKSVHILINNAHVLRSAPIEQATDKDWDLLNTVNVFGSYKCIMACWPSFRKQKFGRIINITSAAGLFAAPNLSQYSSTKLGIVGFSSTLAKEGAKYNILVNTISPVVVNEHLKNNLPASARKNLNAKWVAVVAGFLCRKENRDISGKVLEVAGGRVCELRMERAKGAKYKCDSSLTSSALLKLWDQINDFSEPDYPTNITSKDYLSILEETSHQPSNPQGVPITLNGKVAVVTGSGGGLGRAYALLLGKMGAKVLVNDVMNPEKVVSELKAIGAEAVGDKNSVEEGEKIIETAIKHFGSIDILINNAGILRDKSFSSMEDNLWQQVQGVHVTGTYKCTKAAWPYFLKQKYGRVVNTCSASGLYGNFGQSNYSAAKMSIAGLSLALSAEGNKHGIKVNIIAPTAGTNMTRTIMPEEYVQAFKPDYIAPLVALLVSEKSPSNGSIFEVGSGWAGRVRLQRSQGYLFESEENFNVDLITQKWQEIIDFESGSAAYPENAAEALQALIISPKKGLLKSSATSSEVNSIIGKKLATSKFTFSEKDVILYNLGVGATKDQLKWVYEASTEFEALPTFGVVPQFQATASIDLKSFLPNFDQMKLLHGEHCLEIFSSKIPTSGSLVSEASIVDVIDKGKAAAVVVKVVSKTENGSILFVNQSLLLCRGAGGFGYKQKGRNRGFATQAVTVPKRPSEKTVSEKTSPDQAALYRLSGDYNPLHIDTTWKVFERPILHGLCSLGISAKHIYQEFGPIQKIKCRFSGHVFPGEKLKTEMWKEGTKVIFQTKVLERDSVVLSSAVAELRPQEKSSLTSSVRPAEAISGYESSKYLSDLPKRFQKLSDSEKKEVLSVSDGIYELDVMDTKNKTMSWIISDLQVFQGEPPRRPDCILILGDADLKKILEGKASPMKLYLSGDMKIKGNVIKSQKLGKLFERLP